MAQPEKTEPLPVCVDTDVLIARLLSRTGASHAILVLGELGLLRLVLPEAAVAEVRRNLAAKLPEAAPFSEELLRSVPHQIHYHCHSVDTTDTNGAAQPGRDVHLSLKATQLVSTSAASTRATAPRRS